jgi:flagellar biosynthetic protein FliP
MPAQTKPLWLPAGGSFGDGAHCGRSVRPWSLCCIFAMLAMAVSGLCTPAAAQQPVADETTAAGPENALSANPADWVSRERLGGTLQVVLTMSVLSLAPALLLMTTSFVRIAVVLGLLRQALGIGQLPSNQVITSIALFMTLLIMTPVWNEVYRDAIEPYTDPQGTMSLEQAWQAGVRPIRAFMSRQIEIAGNSDDVWLFYQYLPQETAAPATYDDVPLQVLLPAFVLSELKIAFLIGFQIYLPFIIVDLVVSSVTMSMGMVMLPPMMISLPMKLLLFVLVDGWNLVVGMLMSSFAPYT